MTLEERNARQREYRKQNGNKYTKKYEKTRSGFLMRCYRNMQSQVTGVQKQKYHLYQGKELLPRDEFYEWAKDQWSFYELWLDYWRSGYDQKLCPSVNRIDPNYGYTPDNMEWITHSQNSRLGSITSHILQGHHI
jgi:hypothetical protein